MYIQVRIKFNPTLSSYKLHSEMGEGDSFSGVGGIRQSATHTRRRHTHSVPQVLCFVRLQDTHST